MAIRPLRFDLHVHSKYSLDSKTELEDIILEAKKRGLDGIALTDHDSVAGNKEALRLGKKHSFLVIPGLEVSSDSGHILILGTTKIVPPKLSVKKTIKRAHELGALAIASHPFRFSNHLCVGYKAVTEDFDCIEVHNAATSLGNRKAKALAKKYNLVGVAGSDTHTLEDLGRAVTVIKSSPDLPSILKAIKRGDVTIEAKHAGVRRMAKRLMKMSVHVAKKKAGIAKPTLIL